MVEIQDIKISEGTPTEPITLNQVKDWLRIEWVDDDDLISRLVTSSRQAIEHYASISLVSKIIECHVCGSGEFELPYGPIGDVAAESNGSEVNLPITGIEFKRVFLNGSYKLTYTAGYTTVPERLKLAILNDVAYRYQNRGDQSKDLTTGSLHLCEAALHIADQYRRMAWL